jgi:hypothetical protein
MKVNCSILILLASASPSWSFAASNTVTQKSGTGVHLPIGKDGEGEYTAATKGCFDVIGVTTPSVISQIHEQSIRTIGSPAIHIADFGTADAGKIIHALLSRLCPHRSLLNLYNSHSS